MRPARQGTNCLAAPQAARANYRETHDNLAWETLGDEKCFAIAAATDSAVASEASIATGNPAFRKAAAVTGPTAAKAARIPSRETTSAPSSVRKFSTADGLKNDTTSTRASQTASRTPPSHLPIPPL